MKSKKRHHGSSDESEEWDINAKSSSTSESESEDSSISEHRHKKKRKRAESSESDSNSDDAKRSKKRKHKKKKKKHGKKKRRAESVESADNASVSEGEVVSKKKKKHKHKHKRTRTTTNTNTEVINSSEEEEGVERRLHSVVKERRSSLGDANQPSRTYYQKEYRRSASVENYGHENEVPRFYQGSSKEQHKYHANDQYNYNRQHNDRFLPQTEKYDNTKEKYAQSGRYHNIHEENNFKQRDYEEFKRPRYEERRPDEDYNKKPREKIPYYREDARETIRFKQYEERGPKRREFFDARDNRDRRGPQDPDRFREREFVDKVEKLREDRYSSESDTSTENTNAFGQNMLLLQRYLKFFTLNDDNSRHV